MVSDGVEFVHGIFQLSHSLGIYLVIWIALVDVKERVLDYDELVGDLVKVDEESIDLKINLKGRKHNELWDSMALVI